MFKDKAYQCASLKDEKSKTVSLLRFEFYLKKKLQVNSFRLETK